MITAVWSFIAKGGWKWLLAAAILSFALKFGYEAYTDYQDLIQTQIELTERNARLANVNAVNNATITQLKDQAVRNEINRSNLEASLRLSEQRANDLERLLSKHDLEFLAINKPGLIERRINDATNDVFNDISCATDPNCVR